MPAKSRQTRKEIAARWYRKRAKDPEFLAAQAEKMRKIRAKWTPEKKEEVRQKRLAIKPLLMLQAAGLRAKRAGLAFDLDEEWLAQNWTGRCALTDFEFDMRARAICPFSPSIDRIDNDKGYLKGNCRFILFGLNALKNTGTDADLRDIAQALLARNTLK